MATPFKLSITDDSELDSTFASVGKIDSAPRLAEGASILFIGISTAFSTPETEDNEVVVEDVVSSVEDVAFVVASASAGDMCEPFPENDKRKDGQ